MLNAPFGTLLGFASLSRSLSSPVFAQGFGGNVSVKLDRRRMAIKASGFRLSQVNAKEGFCILDYQRIAGIYGRGKNSSERKSDALVRSSVLAGGSKPSIETAFHSFLGTYVAHLHPVHLNVINCQKDAGRLIAKLFGKRAVFVNYAKPGHRLAALIREKARGRKNCIIFLQNHGVIISCPSKTGCRAKMLEIERVSLAYLRQRIRNFREFSYGKLTRVKGGTANLSPSAVSYSSDSSNAGRFLFPDAVVFSSGIFSGSGKISAMHGKGIIYRMPRGKACAIDEIISAHMYLLEFSEKLGKPRYLSRKDAAELISMESEKHRQKLAGV